MCCDDKNDETNFQSCTVATFATSFSIFDGRGDEVYFAVIGHVDRASSASSESKKNLNGKTSRPIVMIHPIPDSRRTYSRNNVVGTGVNIYPCVGMHSLTTRR